MNTSNIFKAAHELTKSVIQSGDSYSVTFALSLKEVYSSMKNETSNAIEIEFKPVETSKNGKLYVALEAGLAKEGAAIIAVTQRVKRILQKDIIILGERKPNKSSRRSNSVCVHVGFKRFEYTISGVGIEYEFEGKKIQRYYLTEK